MWKVMQSSISVYLCCAKFYAKFYRLCKIQYHDNLASNNTVNEPSVGESYWWESRRGFTKQNITHWKNNDYVIARRLYLTGYIKWNESGFKPPLCTYRLNWARRTSWGWWDDRDDTVLQTGFEIRALAVWGRARYLSVTEAPHNTDFHTLMGKKHFYFFQTAETGNRTPNSGVKGSGANHYPRAPAQPNNLLAYSKTNTLTLILLNLFYYKLWRCSLRLMTWCEICYHIL